MAETAPAELSLSPTPNPTPIDVALALQGRLAGTPTVEHIGRVVRAIGTSIRVSGLPVKIGQRCEIGTQGSGSQVLAEVVGIEREEAVLFPLGDLYGVALGSDVRVVAQNATVNVSDALLGRVLDGFGRPLDTGGPLIGGTAMPLRNAAPDPLTRRRIDTCLHTGVKVIDALLSVGVGQRVGIFAPAGAGKSTVLGMLSRSADVDVIVIGLIGERGREVREFLDETLTTSSRSRAVTVVATSDRPAMERVAAANTATAIAEGFRARGKHVLLLMDSVTRYARALREVGLAAGEPPVRHGFTPSVFAELPRLFERSGRDDQGAISAFYTVLTDDEDGTDPIAEEARSILDGNIVLSRELAQKARFPAIDVLASISRLFNVLHDADYRRHADRFRALMAKYREIEFLLQVGEYELGTDADADAAVATQASITGFLQQSPDQFQGFEQTLTQCRDALQADITSVR